MSKFPFTATECASAFSKGEISAGEIATVCLERISHANPSLNAYIEITNERAQAEAKLLDAARLRGETKFPLGAVPYAVKNLFDVEGITTLAGAKLYANNPPARRDARLVKSLQGAGGLLTGTLNMDAYAYGFTTENTHYGSTHNPRDLSRSAGGSSGGTGAAVAAGLVPIGIGSDTNGSIRVPSSLCGVFGLKPTYGRLSRSGTLPFVASLDHLGPLATTVEDLALSYDAMQGHDPHDPACAQQPIKTTVTDLPRGIEGLRIARLTGYFDEYAGADAQWASRAVAKALLANDEVEVPGVEQARSAAYLMTASESGALYLDALCERMDEFEPHSLERLIAGSLIPAAWYQRALRYRRAYLDRVLSLFEHFDLLIAPATPVTAPLLGQKTIQVGSRELPTRPNMGLLTQPISFVGLPVAVAPLWPDSGLPMGVQLIAPPWREDLCLRGANVLEKMGISSSKIDGGVQ
jgi:AtzE family amidohydrolase